MKLYIIHTSDCEILLATQSKELAKQEITSLWAYESYVEGQFSIQYEKRNGKVTEEEANQIIEEINANALKRIEDALNGGDGLFLDDILISIVELDKPLGWE